MKEPECKLNVSLEYLYLVTRVSGFAVTRNFVAHDFYPPYNSTNRQLTFLANFTYTACVTILLKGSMLRCIICWHDHDESRFNKVRKAVKSFLCSNELVGYVDFSDVLETWLVCLLDINAPKVCGFFKVSIMFSLIYILIAGENPCKI